MMKLVFAAVLVSALYTLPARADDPFLADPEPTAPGDNPAPSLGKEATPAAKAEVPPPAASPAPPTPEAQAPVPLSSIPGKTDSSSVPAASANGNGQKDIYEQYYDYLDHEADRQKTEKDLSQRALFPHENGGWQLGFNYARNAFNGYNFNRSTIGPKMYGDTQGANLMVTWFPLKSLTFGRLGFGPTGGIYWTTFNTVTPSQDAAGTSLGTATTKASPQEVTSYGVRAVYELDYFLGQILVPFAFVGFDNVIIKNYSISVGSTSVVNIDARHLISNYFGGGIHFNLNRVEPVVASRALVNVGIRKFYLSYMALQRNGDLAGLTHNLGLNFEF